MSKNIARIFQRKPDEKTAKKIAAIALAQDAKRDITSEACVRRGQRLRARIVAKEKGVLCGLREAREVFTGWAREAGGALAVRELKKEGEGVRAGDAVLEVRGSAREILRRERAALNFICILSGIATATGKIAKRFPGKIASLRKTHPLLSLSEKRAVRVGGGITHRLSLADGYLIKNNHITAVAGELGVPRDAAIAEAVERAFIHRRKRGKGKLFIEVEVGSMKEALAAAETRADAVLVDNCKPLEFAGIAKAVRMLNKKIIIEASGGINEGNAGRYLGAGADFVSTSSLTLRAKPLDFALRII